MKKETYISTQEAVERFPSYPFTLDNMGRLLRMGLLRGRYKGRVAEISIESLNELVEYRNQIISKELTPVLK